MIAGLITPSGNLAALTPQPVLVSPIAGEALAVGDLVRFDLGSDNAYSVLANITNYDEATCGFNVVAKAAATNDAGVFAVVVTAAAAGARCTVCVAGVCDAKVTGTVDKGNTPLINGAGVLVPAAAAGTGVGLGIGLADNSSGPNLVSVFFQGVKIGSQSN